MSNDSFLSFSQLDEKTRFNVKEFRPNEPDESRQGCLCEIVLLNNAQVWIEMRRAWMDVIFHGILKEYEPKKKLAEVRNSS